MCKIVKLFQNERGPEISDKFSINIEMFKMMISQAEGREKHISEVEAIMVGVGGWGWVITDAQGGRRTAVD